MVMQAKCSREKYESLFITYLSLMLIANALVQDQSQVYMYFCRGESGHPRLEIDSIFGIFISGSYNWLKFPNLLQINILLYA